MELFYRLANEWHKGSAVAAFGGFVLFIVAWSFTGDFFDSAVFAFLGMLLVAGSLFCMVRGMEETEDEKAIDRYEAGSYAKGDWVVAPGRAVALTDTLTPTYCGRDALACHYVVREKYRAPGDRSATITMLAEGHHMAPAAIETETTRVPIRGLLDLERLPTTGSKEREPEFASALVTADAKFRRAAIAKIAAVEQDTLDVDWKYDDPKRGAEFVTTEERALFPDASVCVFGVWSGEALIPAQRRPRGLPVYPYELAHARAEIAGRGKFISGLGIAGLAVFFGWGAYLLFA